MRSIPVQMDFESGASAGRTVLVFGATGQQGGAVAHALMAQGWPVRALVRDPDSEKARVLATAGVEVVKGDLSDKRSIASAMRGAYGVFSIQPSSGQGAAYGVTDQDEIRYGKNIADIADASGVQHLVYTSVAAAGRGPTGMGHFDSKSEIEAHVRRLNLASTIVRPHTFMEMLMLPGMGLDQGRFSFFMRPDQAMQFIAVDDIGKIVAAIFAGAERFAGRSIEIAGDQLTGTELADAFSKAANAKIVYTRFPESLLAENAFLGRLAALIDDGKFQGVSEIKAFGEEFGGLMSFAEWLQGPGSELFEKARRPTAASIALR